MLKLKRMFTQSPNKLSINWTSKALKRYKKNEINSESNLSYQISTNFEHEKETIRGTYLAAMSFATFIKI